MNQQAIAVPPAKVWHAALYIRLSREDEDLSARAESNSITSQREFLREFLRQHPDITAYDYYVDDGWSGTNFDRPDFQRMMHDIRCGAVDCVIVKDLSRLGRNAAETGNYIDNVFACSGVRFIAVHNYVDTVAHQMNAATHCITVGIQNVINESVAATTSVNVRGTLNVERQQGKFIGSFASYGYRKDPADRHRLVIDEEAAAVVRQIYDWFLQGKSILGIAKALNAQGIPNPSAYKKRCGLAYHHPAARSQDGLWPDSSVRRILQNELYTGTMIQGKTTTISFKHKKCRAVPKEQWYIVPDTHPAIISRETFEQARALFGRSIRKSPLKDEIDLFSGFVRCSDCGRAMGKKTNVHPYGTYAYYRCITGRKMKENACGNHTIRIDKLETAVTVTLQKMIDAAVEMSQLMEAVRQTSPNPASDALRTALAAAQKHKQALCAMQLELYPDWKSGILTQAEYLQLKEKLAADLQRQEQHLQQLQQRLEADGVPEKNAFLEAFRTKGTIPCLTRPLLEALVEEILIHPGGRIEVVFKYRDSYADALACLERSRGETVCS